MFRIPFNGVGSFEVNRTIAQLLDSFPKQLDKPVLKAKCGACRKEEIITTCDHCKDACKFTFFFQPKLPAIFIKYSFALKVCKPCRISHFGEVKSELMKKIFKIESNTDAYLLKEIDSIGKHENNLLKCKEIRQCVQKKCGDLIQRIKDEESKLLDDVDDFERIESSLLADKYTKIKELELMNSFSSSSNKSIAK